jgi:hypothetical protein
MPEGTGFLTLNAYLLPGHDMREAYRLASSPRKTGALPKVFSGPVYSLFRF